MCFVALRTIAECFLAVRTVAIFASALRAVAACTCFSCSAWCDCFSYSKLRAFAFRTFQLRSFAVRLLCFPLYCPISRSVAVNMSCVCSIVFWLDCFCRILRSVALRVSYVRSLAWHLSEIRLCWQYWHRPLHLGLS